MDTHMDMDTTDMAIVMVITGVRRYENFN